MENIGLVIKGCVAGDPRFQKLLYEGYLGFALKIMFRYIYTYERALDLVNDCFIKIFSNFTRFTAAATEEDNRKLLMGYIRRVMINAAIDDMRKESLRPETGTIPDYVWEFSSKQDEADQQLLYRELIILVKQLPPKYRLVFNLHVIDGYDHAEIAGILKIPVGTSKSNLSRAKKILQENLKKTEELKYAV